MRNSKVIRALMLVTQLGISMMVPIFLCVFAGGFIDRKAGTGCFLPVFLFLGIAAAFRNVYYLLKPFYAKDKEREDRELAYIERLKEEGREQALKQKDALQTASPVAERKNSIRGEPVNPGKSKR
ncbi:MAG: AtpZ/AtpI family protein [Lachnospiraceae bacterium]|nr:AtpZ/AtpI family protein [Lachnospiraceae bacterium]